MELAERFNLPVLTLSIPAGAYPGIGRKERGQAEAIARNLRDMSALKVPIIVTVHRRRGIRRGVGDWSGGFNPHVGGIAGIRSSRLKGAASILFHDACQKPKCRQGVKIDCARFERRRDNRRNCSGTLGGAHRDPGAAAAFLKEALIKQFEKSSKPSPSKKLLQARFEKIS